MRLFGQPVRPRAPTPVSEWLTVLEIGTLGIVATIAAYCLGVQRIDMLMAIYFSVTFSGQFVATMLGKLPPFGSAPRDAGGND